MRRLTKIGVRAEQGYEWPVVYIDLARKEAMEFLTEEQYHHVVDQIKSLAMESDPTHPTTVSVDAVDEFFELREKGGPLGKINVRVFFCVVKDPGRMIVVLGAIKKETEGPLYKGDKIRMSRRMRKLLNGEYGT